MKSKSRSSHKGYLRLLVYAALFGLLAVLVYKQRSALGSALSQVAVADGTWLTVSIVAMALSLPATAGVYMALSPKPLKFGRTVLVQTAGFCVNKLLPSGSGAAGVSFLYLRANKVPGMLAGSIVALNNVLGLIGHFLLFWLFVALQPSVLHKLKIDSLSATTGQAVVVGEAVTVLLLVGWLCRRRLGRIARTFRLQVRPLLSNRPALLRALGFSMLITLSYTATLYASAHAVGASIGLSAAIIALSSSVLATSAIPSPGGIGVAELGAYGGLVAVGVNSHAALAAALLYRVCSFWLPLAFGSVAFAVVAKRGYLRVAK